MTVLESCVVYEDKVYCWDSGKQRFVRAKLVADETNKEPVPAEVRKLIAMKQFNLVEREC